MAFWTSSDSGSQLFSDDGYPSHFTRYLLLVPLPRCEMMASTSYSSWLSMMSGGGNANAGPWVSVSWYGDNREVWNTGCIFQVTGSFSRYDSRDRTFSIINGPSLFGENFRGLLGKWRFVASSQTLSPSWNGLNLFPMWRYMCCQANSWAARVSLRSATRWFSRWSSVGKTVGNVAVGINLGLKP